HLREVYVSKWWEEMSMMKKRILAGFLALVLLCLTACSSGTDTEEWLKDELGLNGEQFADTGTKECGEDTVLMGNTESEDPLRICIDLVNIATDNTGWIDQALDDFLFRLKETAGLENVVLELIPSEYTSGGGIKFGDTSRADAIERIQNEIKSGGGPDVFLLSYEVGVDHVNFRIDYDKKNCLFDYPEKAMEYGYFLPLDELMEKNTKLTEWDKQTQPVLEAGRNWEGQQIIPLSYTFPLLCYPKSEWEHVPDKEYTWNDMLTNPKLLPYSLDMANCYSIQFGTDSWPASDYMGYIMGKFADFENEELGFTEEELLQCVNDIVVLKRTDDYEEFPDAQELNASIRLSESKLNKPMTFLPLYNMDGGVTAQIEKYAAINRNTEKAEDAFKVIDLLMSKYVQRWSNIYQDLIISYLGSIPLHEDLFQKSDPLVGNNYYMRADNYEAFCKVREQITCANFDSEGVYMLSEMLDNCFWAAEMDTTVEEIVHETYEEMTRRMKE
ncbi:MAG: hypothetical protein IJO13_03895, partial [Lachnospiraceae bacterium]|nr:hypothetical protein [Lachnospiraceae bacterium]